MANRLVFILRWVVILGLPIVVILTSARSLVSAWYPRYEYSKPEFPKDHNGLSQEQRVELATVAINHLNTPGQASDHIDMLTDERLPDSTQPLYTPSEISHLIDVKSVMNALWRAYAISTLVVGASLAVLFLRRRTRALAADALLAGGLSSAAALVVLIVLVFFGWSVLFTEFHQVFFPAGSWTFPYDSSLIRLFPEKFWYDGGVLLVGGALTAAFTAAALGYIVRDRFHSASAHLASDI